MSRMTCSAGALVVGTTDFWLICTLLRVTQSQKSSTPQPAPDVSWALTPNTAALGGGEDARLARPPAPAGQGVRGAARGLGDHGQAGHDPAHAAPPRPPEPEAATHTLTSQTASQSP